MGPSLDCLRVGAFETNCWIYPLAEDGKAALIDPGDDAHFIITRLEGLRLYPRYILLTHGHFDHLAALPELYAAFAGSPPPGEKKPLIAIHRLDGGYLGEGAYENHRRSFAALGAGSYIDSLWEPLPPPGRLLAEGDTIGPFRVLHLPGHSPGSAAYYDEGAALLFSGDVLFRGNQGRTDLPGGSPEAMERSLRRLLALPAETRVFPGHGPDTVIGDEGRLF
jgi:glyoxylase-like metal-dependent hydrolase (beta-lactamase superfamily II)